MPVPTNSAIPPAKPDARICTAALDRPAADPGDALFIDDTPGHAAAGSGGITGHVRTGRADTIARIKDFLRSRA